MCLVPGGGGGNPIYKPYRYVPPQRVGILCPSFWLKMGIDFAHFGLESSWFSKELRECTNVVVVSISTEKDRKKKKYAHSKWILRNLFCCRSNLSYGDIISSRPGLRMQGKNFRGQV